MSRHRRGGRTTELVFPTIPPDTFTDAPCATEQENLWEPQADGEPARQAQVRWREAAELCHWCPALASCARLADAQESLQGVWAGRIPRVRGERAGVPPAECGTRGGFLAHRRAREEPCDQCVTANRAYKRTYMKQRRKENTPQ